MSHVTLVVVGPLRYNKPARQYIEYYCSYNVKTTVVTTDDKQLPKYYYDNYKIINHMNMMHCNLLVRVLSNYVNYIQALLRLIFSEKTDQLYLFVGSYERPVMTAVFDYCCLKKIKLNIFYTKQFVLSVPDLEQRQRQGLQKFVENVLNFQKQQIIEYTALKSKEPTTQIDEKTPLTVLQHFDTRDMEVQFCAALAVEVPHHICSGYFDKHINLYSQSTNPESFQNGQVRLFSQLSFAQPERTELGIRSLFYYTKAIFNENGKEGAAESTQPQVQIVKNPQPPQLIVVPLPINNNKLGRFATFATQVNNILQQNQHNGLLASRHMIMAFTMQPNANLAAEDGQGSQIKHFTRVINKNKHVSASFVQLRDADFEILVKSADYCLVGRNQSIIRQINDFGQFCVCLVEKDDADDITDEETKAKNIFVDNEQDYGAIWLLATEGKDKMRDMHVVAENVWQ